VKGCEQRAIGDERVSLRIRWDADLAERVPDLGEVAQERQPVRVGAGLLLVATDHERAVDPAIPERRDEVTEVLAVPHHPRRQVRDDCEPGRPQLARESDGRLEALGRRRGHRHRGARRQQRRLVERVLERDEFERRRLEQLGERGAGGRRQARVTTEQHGSDLRVGHRCLARIMNSSSASSSRLVQRRCLVLGEHPLPDRVRALAASSAPSSLHCSKELLSATSDR
jgi:hypothetical protein